MLKPYSKFQNSMLKGLKVILTFTYHYVPLPGECFSSLVQAMTSQAESCKHRRLWFPNCLYNYLNSMFLG